MNTKPKYTLLRSQSKKDGVFIFKYNLISSCNKLIWTFRCRRSYIQPQLLQPQFYKFDEYYSRVYLLHKKVTYRENVEDILSTQCCLEEY